MLQIQCLRSHPQVSLRLLYFHISLAWHLSDSWFHFMYLTTVLCYSMAYVLLALTIIIYEILPQNKPRSICFLVAPQTSWNAAREADSEGKSEMIQSWGESEHSTSDFDSLVDWKIGVGFNSTKWQIFHFGTDKDTLWVLCLEAINEGGKKKTQEKQEAKPRLVRNPSTSTVMYPRKKKCNLRI